MRFWPALFFLTSCFAQETVAPTNLALWPARGTQAGGYNITDSVETGYRFAVVNGSQDQYRSIVNFGTGIRVLGSSLTVHSRTGHGRFFDEIVLITQGLGNDPYESATLRVQKNRLYRYAMLWRSNDYFNPGFTISGGLHKLDLRHRWQDHDLLLFPNSKLRVQAGYSRTAQNGAALTTVTFLDPTSSAFPVFADVKREWNEYRLSGDLTFAHLRLTVLRRWELYKEDSPLSLVAPERGNQPTDSTTLTGLYRTKPYHGSTPGWLVNLTAQWAHLAVNGRFTESSGNRGFVQAESASGTDASRLVNSRQITVTGNAQRPVVTGDVSISVLPTDRVTLVNTTSVHNVRIDGNAAYTEFDNATAAGTTLYFQFLGIRRIENATDAHWRVVRSLDVYGGYRYTAREVRSINSITDPATPFSNMINAVDNHLHAGLAGFNWTPLPALRVRFEGELGRDDHPFTPTADAKYHALNAMVQYRVKLFQLRAGYRQNYNNNSAVVTSYAARSRSVYADTSFTAGPHLSLDASYSHLHLDTLGGIAFFAGAGLPKYVTGFDSLYSSNIHAANIAVHATLQRRVDFYVGYSITQDTGSGAALISGGIAGLLSSAQQFPLTYQSPLARVSVKLHEKLRWNAGYQYYGYREDFHLLDTRQDFRAHTGYTSLTWAW